MAVGKSSACLLATGLVAACDSSSSLTRTQRDPPPPPVERQVEVVLVAPGVTNLLALGGELYWAESSDTPIRKTVPSGVPSALAVRLEHPEPVAIRGADLWIVDTSSDYTQRLLRMSLSGGPPLVVASGDGGPIASVADGFVWVSTTQSRRPPR